MYEIMFYQFCEVQVEWRTTPYYLTFMRGIQLPFIPFHGLEIKFEEGDTITIHNDPLTEFFWDAKKGVMQIWLPRKVISYGTILNFYVNGYWNFSEEHDNRVWIELDERYKKMNPKGENV